MMEDNDFALWASYGLGPCQSPKAWPQSIYPGEDLLDSLLQEAANENAIYGHWEDPSEEPSPRGPSRCRGRLRPGERTPSPRSDRRGPAEDGYDVVEAIASFARCQQPPEGEGPLGQRRREMQEAQRLRARQAQHLGLAAGNPEADPDIRSHYAKIRLELLAEAHAVDEELTSLAVAVAGAGEGGSGALGQHL
mmetsp:Transcript_82979/g.230490  ORF Transcript_82979/g.230490 Transcript_82979/m.230490 type:complete len:193 (-) Transcript_82979:112-690(-)